MKFALPQALKSSSSPPPTFDRVHKYRPPPTSHRSSVQFLDEEFGTPRTSTQVKQAYLDSQANSDVDSNHSSQGEHQHRHQHQQQQLHHHENESEPALTPSLVRSSISSSSISSSRVYLEANNDGQQAIQPPPSSRPSPTLIAMTDVDTDHARPTHGRGTAAEQGAGLRAAADRAVGDAHDHERKGSRRSHRRYSRESPRTAHRALADSEKHADDDHYHSRRSSRRASRNHSRNASDVDAQAISEKRPAGTAAQQGAAFRKGQIPEKPSAQQTREARERHLRAAYGETPLLGKGSPNKPPVYPMTGIDNLALLMEDDSYTTSCFSIYMFKTELDLRTVTNFFEVLAETYLSTVMSLISTQSCPRRRRSRL